MALQSMTGFAAREGGDDRLAWRWELRSVNARGLDLRYRGPESRDALEAAFRAAAKRMFARGSVSASLRLARRDGAAQLRVAPAALDAVIAALAQIRAAVEAAGLPAAPVSVETVLGHRGVLDASEPEPGEDERAAQDAAMLADGVAALGDLAAARAEEGARLEDILAAQVDRIAELTGAAEAVAAARAAAAGPMLQRKLAALGDAGKVDADRVAQELAILAVKGDVREELDRLGAHVAAARELLAADGAVGRRLDFLIQEFNREANTLCSKADFTDLTAVGLELKAVIDQMREQVQNIE